MRIHIYNSQWMSALIDFQSLILVGMIHSCPPQSLLIAYGMCSQGILHRAQRSMWYHFLDKLLHSCRILDSRSWDNELPSSIQKNTLRTFLRMEGKCSPDLLDTEYTAAVHFDCMDIGNPYHRLLDHRVSEIYSIPMDNS